MRISKIIDEVKREVFTLTYKRVSSIKYTLSNCGYLYIGLYTSFCLRTYRIGTSKNLLIQGILRKVIYFTSNKLATKLTIFYNSLFCKRYKCKIGCTRYLRKLGYDTVQRENLRICQLLFKDHRFMVRYRECPQNIRDGDHVAFSCYAIHHSRKQRLSKKNNRTARVSWSNKTCDSSNDQSLKCRSYCLLFFLKLKINCTFMCNFIF